MATRKVTPSPETPQPYLGPMSDVVNQVLNRPRSITKFILDLTYENYVANRERSPEVSPERWEKVYGQEAARSMEARYQTIVQYVLGRKPVNQETGCEGFEPLDATGETAVPCGDRTVKCPICNGESGLCEIHLWECHKCGRRMCSECCEAVDYPCRGCQESVLEETKATVNAALDEIMLAVRS